MGYQVERINRYSQSDFASSSIKTKMTIETRVISVFIVLLLIDQYAWINATDIALPDDIHEWCPYTKFCHLDPNQMLPANEAPEADIMFCCEACSCLNDCGIQRTCCRDELDRYKYAEELNMICKQLVIINDGDAYMNEHYFHIVDKCPNVSENCNNKRVAPWGSYHPFYSYNSRFIYYNKWCAKCHNQTNIIPFETTIQSTIELPSSIYLTDVLFGRSINSEVFIRFLPPYSASLAPQLCYPLTIKECNPRSRDLENLSKLCQSFNATYHDGIRTYANIYCYICSFNDKPLDEIFDKVRRKDFCDSTLSSVFSPKATSPLTFLLNSKTTQLTDGTEDINDENEPVWCEAGQSRKMKNCRRIYCPEGQFRFDGECDFLGDTWFVQSISVLIKLSPRSPLLLDEVNSVNGSSDIGESTVGPRLLVPELFIDWKQQLLYKASETGDHVQYFVTNLRRSMPRPFNPMKLLRYIDKSLQKPWTIVMLNKSHELYAELDTHLGYSPYTDIGIHIPEWLNLHMLSSREFLTQDVEVNCSFFLMELYNDIGTQQLGNIVISRMYFCEQVELLPQEFVFEQQLVFLKEQERYLGRGSFVRLPKGNQSVFRVCLTDLLNGRSTGIRSQPAVSDVVLQSTMSMLVYFNLVYAKRIVTECTWNHSIC